MQINVVIIAPDNTVIVNGHAKTVPLDMPHINAVRFDGVSGSIEHRRHEGEWLSPRELSAEDFEIEFGAVLTVWEETPDPEPEVLEDGLTGEEHSQVTALQSEVDALKQQMAALIAAIDVATEPQE